MNPLMLTHFLQILSSDSAEQEFDSIPIEDGSISNDSAAYLYSLYRAKSDSILRAMYYADQVVVTDKDLWFLFTAGFFFSVGVVATVLSVLRRFEGMRTNPIVYLFVVFFVWMPSWYGSVWISAHGKVGPAVLALAFVGLIVSIYVGAKSVAYSLPDMDIRPGFRKPMAWMSWVLGSNRQFLDPKENDHQIEDFFVVMFPLVFRWGCDFIEKHDPRCERRIANRWFVRVSHWMEVMAYPPWKSLNFRSSERGLAKVVAPPKGFLLHRFMPRIAVIWDCLKKAWNEQELSSVRLLLSDGMHEKLVLQTTFLNRRGMREKISRAGALDLDLVDFCQTGGLSSATVRIEGLIRDRDLVASTGEEIMDREAHGITVEYWTFLKSGGMNSVQPKGLEVGSCPRCAGIVPLGGAGNCPTCGAWLRSGLHDWVLAEISLGSEWMPRSLQTIPGAQELGIVDPGFHPQDLEDRAAVIFWRTVGAIDRNAISDISRFASAGVVAKLQEWRGKFRDAEVFLEPEVGVLDLKQIRIVGESAVSEFEIVWKAGPDSVWPGATDELRKQRNVSKWTLVRSLEVRSHERKAFASASCPSCGAPDTNSKDGHCAFCGGALGATELDWHLHQIESGFPPLGI